MLKVVGWIFLILFLIGFIVNLITTYAPVFVILLLIFIAWKIYEFVYFKGEKFNSAKARIQTYIADCNDLNKHIEELKNTALVVNTAETGIADYKDNSTWKMKRPAMNKRKNEPNIHYCSRTVCDNASKAPFKYICKYFGIKPDEDTLAQFETILNNFEAAEEGKHSLKKERESILASVSAEVPSLIKLLSKQKLEKKLGFDTVDFKSLYFPKYVFMYTSSGGNASTQCDITMDIENLNKFVVYLSELVKFRNSAAGQRALMTSKLRNSIKTRDNFTCRKCGVSVAQEPHLLLEIDHIVPVSKGGLTTEENLQTLCWRCNRSKGAKI